MLISPQPRVPGRSPWKQDYAAFSAQDPDLRYAVEAAQARAAYRARPDEIDLQTGECWLCDEVVPGVLSGTNPVLAAGEHLLLEHEDEQGSSTH